MKLELFDNLEVELEKALKDEKHQLAESVREMSAAMRAYMDEVTPALAQIDDLINHIEVLQGSNDDMLEFIKNFYIILNAEKETAMQIKGMSDILKAMAQLIVAPASIKSGVVRNAKS